MAFIVTPRALVDAAERPVPMDRIAETSVAYADALIKALAR